MFFRGRLCRQPLFDLAADYFFGARLLQGASYHRLNQVRRHDQHAGEIPEHKVASLGRRPRDGFGRCYLSSFSSRKLRQRTS